MSHIETLQCCVEVPKKFFPIFCRVLRNESEVKYVRVTHPDTVQKLKSDKSSENQLKILQQLPGWSDNDWRTLLVKGDNGELKCEKNEFYNYPGPNDYTCDLDLPRYTMNRVNFIKHVNLHSRVWKVKLDGKDYFAKFAKELKELHRYLEKNFITPWQVTVDGHSRKVGFDAPTKIDAMLPSPWRAFETEIRAYSVLEGASLTPKLVGYITGAGREQGDGYTTDPSLNDDTVVAILIEDAGHEIFSDLKDEVLELIDRVHYLGVRHGDLSIGQFGVMTETIEVVEDEEVKEVEKYAIRIFDFEFAKFDNGLDFWEYAEGEKSQFTNAFLAFLP